MFRTFGTLLVKAAENSSNKILSLGLFRQEKSPGPSCAKPGWLRHLETLGSSEARDWFCHSKRQL